MAQASYRLLWVSYALTLCGRFLHGVALSWLVWKLTASPGWLSAIAVLSGLPLLPLSPYVGSLADRCSRRVLVFVTQSVGAALAALTAALTFCQTQSPVPYAVIAFLFGLVSSVDSPALHAMMIDAQPQIEQSVARQSLVMNGARALAPLAAIALIEIWGSAVCFLINAASFLPLLAVLAFRGAPAQTPTGEAVRHTNVRQWYRLFRQTPALFGTLPFVAILALFVTPCVALLPAIALPGAELASYGSMSSGLGAGAVAVALLMQMDPKLWTQDGWLTVGGVLYCICFAIVSVTGTILAQWGCAFLMGGALTLALAAANRRVQAGAFQGCRGTFSSMYLTCLLGLAPVGQLMVGAAAELLGARCVVQGFALLGLALTLACAWAIPRYWGCGQDGR